MYLYTLKNSSWRRNHIHITGRTMRPRGRLVSQNFWKRIISSRTFVFFVFSFFVITITSECWKGRFITSIVPSISLVITSHLTGDSVIIRRGFARSPVRICIPWKLWLCCILSTFLCSNEIRNFRMWFAIFFQGLSSMVFCVKVHARDCE